MRRTGFIRKAIELGRPNGFVTFDQLDKLLQAEDIEQLLGPLNDEGINVIEGD